MRNLIISLLLLLSISSKAQVDLIKGRVVDSRTQDGIAYTNIGVEGTFYGTASDPEGFFELKIPEEFKTEKIYFSAVGYQSLVLNVDKLTKKEFSKVDLLEQTYNLDTVNVAAQSRVLFRVVKTASQKIPENFHQGPLGMKMYYEEIQKPESNTIDKREAVINLYDETAYASPSISNAFKNRNFQFVQVKKNFESYSIPQGSTGFEELLEMDLARLSNTLLNQRLLNDYDLQLEDISQFNGDSVWIIAYQTNKADLAHTGDYYATEIKGKIYISQNNYEIIRNECLIKASKNHPHSRSLATKGDAQTNVNYHYTTTYKPMNGKFALSYVDCDKTYIDSNGENVTYRRKAYVLELDRNPSKISGKDYFENETYVENFWNSFKRPELNRP